MAPRWLTFGLFCFALSPLHAQESLQGRFETARVAWDEGRFIEALEAMEGILLNPGGAEFIEPIALLTGEVYQVVEVTADGRGVRWSPDGGHAAYESELAGDPTTHLLAVDPNGVRELASIPGTGLVFAPSGRELAYLVVPDTEALVAARAELQDAFPPVDRAARYRLRAEMARLNAEYTQIVVRDLASGRERRMDPDGIGVLGLLYNPGDGTLYFVGAEGGEAASTGVYRLGGGGEAARITPDVAQLSDPFFARGGDVLVFGTGRGSFGVLDVSSGSVQDFQGTTPALSADGRTLAFMGEDAGVGTLNVLPLSEGSGAARVVARTPDRLSNATSRACAACPLLSGLSLSPRGDFLVFQAMPREDWELFLVPTDASADDGRVTQLTREIQHDLFPQVLADGRILAPKGEGRHRRSYLHDLDTGEVSWLFRNNTTRTVSPEYEWAPSPDGTKLLIVAERDGNTVSPERGVYLKDLSQKVTAEEVLARVQKNLTAERDLLDRARAMYGPVNGEVQEVVNRISMPRIFQYEEALFRFGSKHVTQPGNALAIAYLEGKLQEWGYEPELQWFDARGVQSANVVVRIPGSVSPEVVYAVSAHFDSNARSPGADDNTSATVGLLEMARVLAGSPLPATIEIAFFTGEESGLLGSREYVRRAVESQKLLVGALNNDMVGYAEDNRLDNTIRYSNKGIRDLQHGAALLFSRMTLHDAEYYKSTDAAAYYDAYGDIVGGIGSYPILASPHYHQVSDVLETVNHQLVTEVAKVTTASMMLMASSPSRLKGLEVSRVGGEVRVDWVPAVETDVKEYLVAWGPEGDPFQNTRTVREPQAALGNLSAGTVVSVKAVNDRRMAGWDWARGVVGK